MMTSLSRILNRSAVRAAFHGHGVRVPRGFLNLLEQELHGHVRRLASGELPPEPDQAPPPGSFVKMAVCKQALRQATGRLRVGDEGCLRLNRLMASRIDREARGQAARRPAGRSPAVPSRAARFFLRSPECREQGWTLERFWRAWGDPAARAGWEGRMGAGAGARPGDRER